MIELNSKDPRIKPLLKWAGGKSSLIASLTEFFPTKFDRYMEPFVGGGAVFFSLQFGNPSLVNDFNLEIVSLYEVVRDQPGELMTELTEMARHYSEEYFYMVRSQTPEGKCARAARTIFLNKTGFNGLYRQNAKGGFNVPFGKRPQCPALFDEANLIRASQLLHSASLSSCDFEVIIDKAGKGDFVYCDPPYEPLTKTSSFNSYKGGGFTQADQLRLMNCCARAAQRGAWIVISNSAADFIKDLYKEHNIHFVQASRAINSKGDKRGKIDEVVVVFNQAEMS